MSDNTYVIWDAGTIEAFEYDDDARHEVSAAGSRGLHGVLIDDVIEAITHMARRQGVDLYYVSNGPVLKEVGPTPYVWRTSTDPAGYLYRHAEEEKYWLITQPYWEAESTDLDGLPDLLASKLTQVGNLENELVKLKAVKADLEAELAKLKKNNQT